MSLSKQGSKAVKLPSKSPGVKFFDQFLRNFIRPYGETDVLPKDPVILRRLKPFNCELLTRPQIGMSELAASIDEPLLAIGNLNSQLVDPEAFERLTELLTPLNDVLTVFNSKKNAADKTTNGPSGEDVKTMLKCFFNESSELEEAIRKAYLLSSNLLTLSTNYIVARALFRNPEEYGEKSELAGKDGVDFKREPTIKGVKKMLKAFCVAGTASQPKKMASKSLCRQLESSEEEEEAVPMGKGKGKAKQVQEAQLESTTDETHEEEQMEETTTKKKRRHKEKAVLEEEEAPPKKRKKSKKAV